MLKRFCCWMIALIIFASPSSLCNAYAMETVPSTALKENCEPELPSTEPELPSTEPELPSTEPELPSAEPELPSTQPELPSTEPELPSTEPELPSTEPELPSTQPELPSTEPELPSATEPVAVDRVVQGGSPIIELLEINMSAASLDFTSDYLNVAAVVLADGRREVFPITYQIEQFDSSVTGLFLLYGTIIAPEGRTISPELAGVTVPVFVYDNQAPLELPIIAYQHNPALYDSRTVAIGTDIDTLQKAFNPAYGVQIYYDVAGGYLFVWDVVWDLSHVDVDTDGIYQLPGILSLPKGVLLPADFAAPHTYVTIQDPALLSLSQPVVSQFYLEFSWVKNTPNIEDLRFWWALEDGEWSLDDSDYNFAVYDSDGGVLYVDKSSLSDGVRYRFQIEYEGEFSNIMEVTFSEKELIVVNDGGDRDGGDRDDQMPPPVTQPPPTIEGGNNPSADSSDSGGGVPVPSNLTPPKEDGALILTAKPSPPTFRPIAPVAPTPAAPTALIEEDTADYTIWSGSRLMTYREVFPNTPFVFEKHGIRLEVPSNSIAFSKITKQTSLRVDLTTPSADSVCLSLLMDGSAFAEPLPLTVTMPWQRSHAKLPLQVFNQEGQYVTDATYSDTSDSIHFVVEGMGTYTVKEMPAMPTPPAASMTAEDMPPPLISTPATVPTSNSGTVAIGAALVGSGLCGLYRWNVRKSCKK